MNLGKLFEFSELISSSIWSSTFSSLSFLSLFVKRAQFKGEKAYSTFYLLFIFYTH